MRSPARWTGGMFLGEQGRKPSAGDVGRNSRPRPSRRRRAGAFPAPFRDGSRMDSVFKEPAETFTVSRKPRRLS
jgi:hypothetical protein